MQPKYPIKVQLTGNDGNAMTIMSNVGRALMRNGVLKEEVDAFYQEAMSGDYDDLLQTAMRWVEVEWWATVAESVLHVAQHVRYVLSEMRKIMSEPREDDDIALDIENDEEELDDEFDTLEEKYGID